MKKTLRYFLTGVLLTSLSFGVKAQIFFTEDFEGTPGGNDLPTGFTETGLSNDGIWSTDNATNASSGYLTFPATTQGTIFAYTNDDLCNCDKSADRMILPAQDFSAMAGVRLYFDVYLNGGYGETGSVEISTDNGSTWTSVNTITANASAWQDDVSINISAYAGAGNTNVLISFLYNDAGEWSYGMGVDDIKLEELLPGPDMELTAASESEYTIVPFSQITTLNLSADVTNVGVSNATDASLTVNVYDATDLVNPIQTTSSAATAVNASATANLTAGSFTPSTLATYVFEYITTATGDASAVNDTSYTSLLVDGRTYARDDGNVTASFGIGGGAPGYLGYMFDVVTTAPIDSVFAAFNKPGTSTVSGDGVGDITRFVIFDVTGGLPNTIIGESGTYTFTPADTSGLITRTLEIQATGGGTLTLTPGTYFVAAEENNTNVGLAFTDNNFQTSTFYYSWPSQAWAAAETFPASFQKASVLRPILGCTLTATTSTTDATCTASDGTATVTASGVAPYTYLWSDGQINQTANNLAAGSYTVTVTDDIGCEITENVTVNSNNTTITASSSTTDASCGNADGTATTTPNNGTSPYTYLWSNGQTTQTANNLAAGSYSVTVTDANGCTGIISGIVVSNPNSPTSSASVSSNYNGAEVSCNGATDGEATASATGGTSPYSYLWSDGQTTATANNLPAGTYTVTVTDDVSCSSVSTVTITEPDALAATDVVTDVSCNGDSNGEIDLTVTGGTGTYTFSWSNSATTEDVTGLTADTYSTTVTDVNGCSLSVGPITVSEPDAIVLTETTTDVTLPGGSDGAIDLTVSGGTPTYTYSWDNGATTEDISGLTAGSYICTVTDDNGCTEQITVTVMDGVASLDNSISGVNSIKLFPNPSSDVVNLSIDLAQTSDINVEVTDASGKRMGSINGVDVLKTNYVLDISSWSTGVYIVKIQTAEGTGVYRFVKQ